jgi:hypothetical protein
MKTIPICFVALLTILSSLFCSAAPELEQVWPMHLRPSVIASPPSVLYDLSPPPTPPWRRFRPDYGIPIREASHVGPRPSEDAEAINATAMRRFQFQWETGTASPSGLFTQPLYPSRVQEAMSR